MLRAQVPIVRKSRSDTNAQWHAYTDALGPAGGGVVTKQQEDRSYRAEPPSVLGT